MAVRRLGGLAGGLLAFVTAGPPARLSAQDVDQLTVRFAAMTAVSGYEQAFGDTLLRLFPGARRDRVGNVVLTLGSGAPRRLAYCSLDEPGYVVGNITDDGFLRLRRVGRIGSALFDQQMEGQRVTVFGAHGAVPAVVAVRSTHLTRGRPNPGEQPFTVDDAWVDIGARSRAQVEALGIEVLNPVALTKRPHRYGADLLAAPAAGRRAACAALAAAALAQPAVHGTVVIGFAVQSLFGTRAGAPGAMAITAQLGPFAETREITVQSRYPETAVETVALPDAVAAMRDLIAWLGAQ